MIEYSIVMNQAPGSTSKKWGAHARSQVRKTMSLNDFADHLAKHKCNYDRADIYAVLAKAVSCMRELVLDGCKVELGDFGSFYATLKSDEADFPNEFTDRNINTVTVNWERGERLRNMRSEATFNRVSTRAMQRAGLEAERNLDTKAFSTAGIKSPTFTVTSTATEGQEAYGTVAGRGVYSVGATATVVAKPNAGYRFTGWSDGVASASRTATADFSATAKFEAVTGGTTVEDPSAD